MSKWSERVDEIGQLIEDGKTMKEIGDYYNVSHQRMYQVFTKYGIETLCRKKKNFLRDKGPEYYWLNKMLNEKGVEKTVRLEILETMEIPTHCPALGIRLNYDGTGRIGYTREDDSPSIDRIYSDKGYTEDNIQIISWRANRIKNDSTPEELVKLASYMSKFISL